MDAAADYADFRRALTSDHLPAYVSYVVRSHAGFDAVGGDDTAKVVVRTSDGKVVAGTPPKISINGDGNVSGELLRRGPFEPACYVPTSATSTMYDGQPAEAIGLRSVCESKTSDDDGDGRSAVHSKDTVFSMLYVDPATSRPIAVVGSTSEKYVQVHIEEHFTVAGGHVVPLRFSVKVAGSGPMFWLNVDARSAYSGYHFSAQPPPMAEAAAATPSTAP
jgi:hypothetical protein